MRRLSLVALAGACGLILTPHGSARPQATADLLLIANKAPGAPDPVAGKPFSLFASVFNNGPDASSFTLRVQVPDGITFRPAGSRPCSGTTDLICAANNPAPPGDDGSGTFGDFIAANPGTYTFVFRLTDLGATDPNSANNEVSLDIRVGQAQHVLAAVRFLVSPRRPRAGKTFSVSFLVLDKLSGRGVAPTSTRCHASLGRAHARATAGRPTCVVATPASARGKTVRIVLTATVAGTTFSHAFAVGLR